LRGARADEFEGLHVEAFGHRGSEAVRDLRRPPADQIVSRPLPDDRGRECPGERLAVNAP
jgi:hypothetical protein